MYFEKWKREYDEARATAQRQRRIDFNMQTRLQITPLPFSHEKFLGFDTDSDDEVRSIDTASWAHLLPPMILERNPRKFRCPPNTPSSSPSQIYHRG